VNNLLSDRTIFMHIHTIMCHDATDNVPQWRVWYIERGWSKVMTGSRWCLDAWTHKNTMVDSRHILSPECMSSIGR
jgi:hypothetical protein